MNIQRLSLLLITLVFLPFFIPKNISAHSGRTDSSGGHNCNVGACAGTYHYHNSGYTAPAPVYNPSTPVPTAKPTARPTVPPTPKPTPKPTQKPTDKPTEKPTISPTPAVEGVKTEDPTPTPQPTEVSDGSANGTLLIPALFILWIFYKYRWVIKERFSRKKEKGGDIK